MRYRLSAKALAVVACLVVGFILGLTGPGLANQVPEACTQPTQVIKSDPELSALCISDGALAGRIPEAPASSGSTGTVPAWLVATALTGLLAVAAAGAVARRRHRLPPTV
jgi:hypothetical protein